MSGSSSSIWLDQESFFWCPSVAAETREGVAEEFLFHSPRRRGLLGQNYGKGGAAKAARKQGAYPDGNTENTIEG